MCSDRQGVEFGNESESKVENMKSDKKEENHSSDALHQVEPVPWIRIGEIIRPCFNGDHQSIDGVIDERYKDAAYLYKNNVGNRLQISYGVIKIRGPGLNAEGLGVGVEV